MFFVATDPIKEISGTCRQLVVDHFDWYKTTVGWRPQPCIHGDVTKIVPEGSFDPKSSFESRLRSINRAPVLLKQFCYSHGKDCNIFGSPHKPDYDLSGLPCPDHSPAGKRLGEEGVTSSVFCCHAKIHIALQTPFLIVENVPDKGCKISPKSWFLF